MKEKYFNLSDEMHECFIETAIDNIVEVIHEEDTLHDLLWGKISLKEFGGRLDQIIAAEVNTRNGQ